MAHRKFHTATITPTCITTQVENGEIIFNPTKVPGACLRDSASLLKSISIHDSADQNASFDLYFMQVSKDLGTAGAAISISAADAKLAKFLGVVTVPGTSSDVGNLINSIVHFKSDINMIVQSDGDDNDEGAIYVAAVASATKTYAADSLSITLGFEVL